MMGEHGKTYKPPSPPSLCKWQGIDQLSNNIVVLVCACMYNIVYNIIYIYLIICYILSVAYNTRPTQFNFLDERL